MQLLFGPIQDIFGSLLRHNQSVQAIAGVHHENGVSVPWQEEKRGAAAFVLDCRQRICQHVKR